MPLPLAVLAPAAISAIGGFFSSLFGKPDTPQSVGFPQQFFNQNQEATRLIRDQLGNAQAQQQQAPFLPQIQGLEGLFGNINVPGVPAGLIGLNPALLSLATQDFFGGQGGGLPQQQQQTIGTQGPVPSSLGPAQARGGSGGMGEGLTAGFPDRGGIRNQGTPSQEDQFLGSFGVPATGTEGREEALDMIGLAIQELMKKGSANFGPQNT